MRAVVQRVSEASVRVDGKITGHIGQGLLVLVGVAQGDTDRDVRFLADKLVNLRIFPDAAGLMNRSVLEVGGRMLIVSQFTLLGDCRKGRRPSYAHAAPAEQARDLCDRLVRAVEDLGLPVATGQFQAMMQVGLVNDGPVTLLIDSRKAF